MIITRHFEANWAKRVGDVPSADALAKILRAAVPVQRGARYKLVNDQHHIQLGIYWHPDLDVVLMIDEINDAAVSVLSRYNFENHTHMCRGGKHAHHPTTKKTR